MSTPVEHRPGKFIGRVMLAASFALVLVILTYIFDGFLDRQRNPNAQPQGAIGSDGIIEVMLQRNRQGHYLSNGEINGHPVEFLLDTGATEVAIPSSVAQRLKLTAGRAGRVMTANGSATVYDTHIQELKLGLITLRDIDASIVPNMGGETILLGMSALQKIDFSQSNGEFTLRQQQE